MKDQQLDKFVNALARDIVPRYSGGLGMANHVGVGAGCVLEPLICLGFCLLFANEKVGRRRPTNKIKLKDNLQ